MLSYCLCSICRWQKEADLWGTVCAYHYGELFQLRNQYLKKTVTFGAKNKHLSLKTFKEKPESCHPSQGTHIRWWVWTCGLIMQRSCGWHIWLRHSLSPENHLDFVSLGDKTPVVLTQSLFQQSQLTKLDESNGFLPVITKTPFLKEASLEPWPLVMSAPSEWRVEGGNRRPLWSNECEMSANCVPCLESWTMCPRLRHWRMGVQSLSRVWLFANPRTAAYQASPSFTRVSQGLSQCFTNVCS